MTNNGRPIVDQLMKVCTRCHTEKVLTDFYKTSKGKYRRDSLCKDCRNAHLHDYRKRNPEVSQRAKRRYNEANREKVLQAAKDYYQRHLERNRVRARNYYYRHRERMQANSRRWHATNPDRAKALTKKWQARNREHLRHLKQDWRARHPSYHAEHERLRRIRNGPHVRQLQRNKYWRDVERTRAYNREYSRKHYAAHSASYKAVHHRRVARMTGNGGSFTAAEWTALCEKYGNVCLACGETAPLAADHIVPVSKGGSSDISNIQPLCRSCNSKKGTRVIDYRTEHRHPTNKTKGNTYT